MYFIVMFADTLQTLVLLLRRGRLSKHYFHLLPASRRAVITLLIDCSRRRLRRRYVFYIYVCRQFANTRFVASAWTPQQTLFSSPAGVPPCRFFPFHHCLRIERFSRYATKATCERNTLEYNSHIQTARFYKVVLK